ncbi:MAG: TonB-dependent receptor [Pseudomonadota bacterium]
MAISLRRQSLLAAAVFAGLTGATPALAELEEIIVTAERREASLQDVPIAVSAYDGQLVERLQIDETLDLINVVPNLFGGNNTGLGTANMYYLRAQGNDESIATFDPPVGTYIDDVYVSRQNGNNFSFFDIERIEVLRGPQGTLFGRNTTGGAINIVLRDPAEEMGGFAEVGFGRYGETIARGTVDLPVSDQFLTKFSAFYIESDGWLDNVAIGGEFNGKDALGLRGEFRFMPSDEITWDLSVDYIDDEEASTRGLVVGDDRTTTTVLPNGLPPGFLQKAPEYGNQTENLSIVSNLGVEFDAGTANLIVGYRNLEQTFLLNFPGAGSDDFFWIDNDGEHEQLTAEFKWSAEYFDDRVNFVSGLFWMDEDNTTDFADYLFGGFLRLADRVLENETSGWAAYAQADIELSDKAVLTVGARYTDEEKEIAFSDNTGAGVLTTANLIAAGVPITQDEQIVTPRVALSYDFTDQVMGYVSATRGFKSGGWNARGTNPAELQPFGPETIWSYEAGFRADLLNNRLRANGTFFVTDLEDLQTTSATPSGAFLTTNAGGLDVQGFELELTAVPTDYWDIFVAIGLQDAEYKDLPAGCVAPNTDFSAFDINCNVADPKRSPDQTYTLGTTLILPIAALGASLQPTTTIRWIGENVVGTRQLGVNDSEAIVNAAIALVDDDNVWSATLECQNCSDEEYITSFLFEPYFSEPMTWRLRLKYNFGAR